MPELEKTKKTTVRRGAKRASYDRDTIHAIIDEALICHIGFVADGVPVVLPSNHWRDGDNLYFHGSTVSRRLKTMREGAEVCVSITLVDGWVLGRSAMNHSMNYRSVVVFGRALPVDDRAEKARILRGLIDVISPDRWEEIRPPSDKELDQTELLYIPLTEASAKARVGPPGDDEEDYALPVWAGVVPLSQATGELVPDSRLKPGTPVPAYLKKD
jgi:uncharacterized protein